MKSLLDINVLIALLDRDHAFHARAHAWWRKDRPQWASCPLTENGVVRIMTSPNYSKIRPFTLLELVGALTVFIAETSHTFWPDSVSIYDSERFEHRRILSAKSLTDLYLLSLAVERKGQLVTFDRGIATSPVIGASSRNLLVL